MMKQRRPWRYENEFQIRFFLLLSHLRYKTPNKNSAIFSVNISDTFLLQPAVSSLLFHMWKHRWNKKHLRIPFFFFFELKEERGREMKKEEQARSLCGISLTERPKWQQFVICSSGFFFGYLVNGICEVLFLSSL